MGMQDLQTNGTVPTMSAFEMRALQRRYQTQEGPTDALLSQVLDAIEKSPGLSLGQRLDVAGPWSHMQTRAQKMALLKEVSLANGQGANIQKWAEWQLKYGNDGLNSNIIVPNFGTPGYAMLDQSGFQVGEPFRVIVGNAADSERIARTHVRKDGSFRPILLESVISTTDNDRWQKQRSQLAEVFLPLSSLAKIMPVSLARAKKCGELLRDVAKTGASVDMSDFCLHEAQAQLQLALLGLPEEFMNATNADLRMAFMLHPDSTPGRLSEAMASIMKMAQDDASLALPSDATPVRGPLSRALQSSDFGMASDYGNALLILFAGHDTTGHAMTWLLFELARHPKCQKELQDEVDRFFAELGAKDPEYTDLSRLRFLDRCITETLRLWPSVPNGTFRQLQFDDEITGRDGKRVTIPRGSIMNLVNWSKQRNPDFWGEDSGIFNPHRDFLPEELTHVGCEGAARNPQSYRFSPFAPAPRSCLGRNFAQMEMRLIIAYLLRSYTFHLAPPYDLLVDDVSSSTTRPTVHGFRGVNLATMGPIDLNGGIKTEWGSFVNYAMNMYVSAR